MALALDERKDSDTVLDVEGYTFLVENGLYHEASPIHIDFNHHYGFSVQSRLRMAGSGSGCSSCSSCG